jgi:hypothetical protein
MSCVQIGGCPRVHGEGQGVVQCTGCPNNLPTYLAFCGGGHNYQNFIFSVLGRHESWKQRTEKRAKEREAEEAEEEETGAGTRQLGQPFRRSGPILQGAAGIKIKITVRASCKLQFNII